jgi:pimeloyl-ACP methyl ester carboxylesterase
LVLAGCAGISSGTREAERLLTLAAMLRVGKKISRWRRPISRSPLLRRLTFGGIAAADPRALSERAANGFLAGSALYTDIRTAGRALVRTEPRLELERVRAPVLVLHGAQDRQVPLADAYEYARRLQAPLRTIADCGHLLIGERPDAVVDAVSDWVRQIDEVPGEAEPVGEALRTSTS